MLHQTLVRHLTDDNDAFGSHYGGGWLSPDGKHFYIGIPKNASSFLGAWLTENGWQIMNFKGLDVRNTNTDAPILEDIVVVLRDPIERFVSGFSQYVMSMIVQPPWSRTMPVFDITDFRKFWPMVERIMVDVGPFFDDHTWPQYYFHEDILPHLPRKYFWLNPRHIQRLFMIEFGLNEPSEAVINNANRAVDQNPIILELQNLVKTSLENPDCMSKIRKEFAYDYQIINSTKFIYHK